MTTEELDIQNPAADNSAGSPGSLLRVAREARGLSQNDVASRLNLRISLIREIEEDNFDKRTASTFTRGYLKTYAKLVGASEDEVLAAFDGLGLGPVVRYSEMHSFSERTKLEANENRMRVAAWVCFVLIAVGALYWILGRPAEKPAVVKIDEQALPKPADKTGPALEPLVSAAQAVPAPDATGVSAAQPAAETAADALKKEGVVLPAAANVSAATPVPAPQADEATAQTGSKPAQTDEASAIQGDLVLSFTGGCWFEVADATGKKLFSGSKAAGQHLALKGKEPFKLTIGAPKFTNITFKGAAVDMKRFPVGRVARFELPLKN